MKHLPVVIFIVMVVLVAVVTGCRGEVRYDARLAAADSLLATAPDSALALVTALDSASLATEGDRAYRDLLVTQARYKCYITATSDSDINRALAYYRAHDGEQEKLTRAYIYKGAVMEELGHPDSAMFYYKHAEATAAPDDYFNLGYVNMRMGALYRDQFANDGRDIHKYEEAIEYLMLTNDRTYQLKCMINLSNLYRSKFPQKADSLYKEAMDLAISINDTVSFVKAAENLIKNYYLLGDFKSGRDVVNMLLANYENYLGLSLYLNASLIYARLHSVDSAQLFLNTAKPYISEVVDKIAYFEGNAEIYLAQGDSIKYHFFESQAVQLEDSLFASDNSYKITKMENRVDEETRNRMLKKEDSLTWQVYLIAFIALCSCLLSFYFLYSRNRYNQLINELKNENQNHVNDTVTMRENLSQLKIQDKELKDFITAHLNLFGEVTEVCYHTPNNILSKEINRIIRFHKKNNENWTKLYAYIDIEYNNIISNTKKHYNHLNDRDILLLALSCLGYSCAQIAIITGYSNATSISGNRQRLAKKMGLDCTLNDYIAKYKC